MNENARRNAFRAIAALAVWGASAAIAGPKNQELPWVQMQNGHLVYGTDAERNRIPDFSTAGYEEGDAPIPDVPVKMRVEALGDNAREQDATARIQSAIEAMSQLPLDEHGIRGALLLGPGTYRIAGTINLDVSGVPASGKKIAAAGRFWMTLSRWARKPSRWMRPMVFSRPAITSSCSGT